MRLIAYRQVSETMRTGKPGPEGSYLQLLWSEGDQRMKDLGIELEGPFANVDRGSARAVDGGRWQYEYLWNRYDAAEWTLRHHACWTASARPYGCGL